MAATLRKLREDSHNALDTLTSKRKPQSQCRDRRFDLREVTILGSEVTILVIRFRVLITEELLSLFVRVTASMSYRCKSYSKHSEQTLSIKAERT